MSGHTGMRPWTDDEDRRLSACRVLYMPWSEVAERLPGRTEKACIQRLQHLSRVEREQGPSRPMTITVAPLKPPAGTRFCGQCDRLVREAEASACASRWCKVKAAA